MATAHPLCSNRRQGSDRQRRSNANALARQTSAWEEREVLVLEMGRNAVRLADQEEGTSGMALRVQLCKEAS